VSATTADPRPTLFVVGAGRAGLGIANAVRAAGGQVVGVHGRRAVDAGSLGAVSSGPLPPSVRDADVVLVAVRDGQLDEAIGAVGEALGTLHGRVVLHASGSADPAAFGVLRSRGVACGTFHPLVPLAEPARAPALLRGAWVGVDGDVPAVEAAARLASRVGANVLRIPAGQKPRYHAAAVFASNFPTVLAALAECLMTDAGVDVDAARGAVRHLLASAAANVAAGDAGAALTGPVVRGDAATVAAHLEALASDPAALAVYAALSRAAVRIALDAGVASEALAGVERLLAGR
jgi:predicted short-subunit dehydrogenase-like oxidoreductase (DUF2520 family)